MHIRPATPEDFEELYAFGKSTPELRVSADQEFMSPEEFTWSLTNHHGVFLVAENEELSGDKDRFLGFIYASTQDAEKPFPEKYNGGHKYLFELLCPPEYSEGHCLLSNVLRYMPA